MRFATFVLGVFIAGNAAAAPLTRDLGQGLIYHRVQEVPADLPTASSARKQPSVLDLRYARAHEQARAALGAWFKARATPTTPILVLANSETDREIRAIVAQHEPELGVLIIGLPAADFSPDLAVQTSAEKERQAYDAMEKGSSLAVLLVDNPDKVRNDEASLSKDRLAEAAADDLAKREARPPVDVALQRAVHVHRALLALKKI